MPPFGPSRNQRPGAPMGRLLRGPLLYLILVLILLYVFLSWFGPSHEVRCCSLSKFQDEIRAGRVDSATIFDRDQRVEGKLKDGTSYRVTYPTDYADDITNQLEERS